MAFFLATVSDRRLRRVELGFVQLVAEALGQFIELDPGAASEGLADLHHFGDVDVFVGREDLFGDAVHLLILG
jgi:hypothetical protein